MHLMRLWSNVLFIIVTIVKKALNISLIDFLIALFTFAIILFGIILAFFLFFKKKGRKQAHILLGSTVLISSLALCHYLINLIGLPSQYNGLYYLPLDFVLAVGPLQYFYFKFKLFPRFEFKKVHLVHFVLPAIEASIVLFVGFSSVSFKYKVWQNGFMDTFYLIENSLFPIICGVYSLKSYRLLKKSALNQKPWKNQLNKWLHKFLLVFVVLISIHVFFMVLQQVFHLRQMLLHYIEFTLLILLLLWTILKAWQQYYPQYIYNETSSRDFLIEELYGNQDAVRFKQKMEMLFAEQQIFTNPDLNLAILKKECGMSERKISIMIKEVFGKSFVEFVNGYRVDYVISALENKEHQSVTLLAIAFDAGFSSKSTFYRTFKQLTKYTPTEYLSRGYK